MALTLGTSTFTDAAVVNGFAYNYFLKAVDGAGLPSDQWAYPHLAAPYALDIAPMVPLSTQPPPYQLTAVAGDNSVTLRWVASQADADTGAFRGHGSHLQCVPAWLTYTSSDYDANSLLPWLQHAGLPRPRTIRCETTQNGLFVETPQRSPGRGLQPRRPWRTGR